LRVNSLSVKDESHAKLPLCLGKNIGGESIIIDLARTPHTAGSPGTTGSGKSGRDQHHDLKPSTGFAPDQCRLIMVGSENARTFRL
jgi:S-DNA-T family DNA segregation ATPase FtsK/SpoIIIE